VTVGITGVRRVLAWLLLPVSALWARDYLHGFKAEFFALIVEWNWISSLGQAISNVFMPLALIVLAAVIAFLAAVMSRIIQPRKGMPFMGLLLLAVVMHVIAVIIP
jgi:hypothetical protein